MFHRPKPAAPQQQNEQQAQQKTEQKTNVVKKEEVQVVSPGRQPESQTVNSTKENAVTQTSTKDVSHPFAAAKRSNYQAKLADRPKIFSQSYHQERMQKPEMTSVAPMNKNNTQAEQPESEHTTPLTQKSEKDHTMSNDQSQQSSNNTNYDVSGNSPFGQRSAPATSQNSSYGSAPYAGTSARTTQSSASSDGRRLVISEGITMSGEIAACDHLVIEGTVEASLQGARVLDVTETGTFYGGVEIEEATIAGRFEGDIMVNGRLTIKDTGTVVGSIAYRELQVEAGATIDGKISPLAASSASESKPSGKQTKKVPARNDNAGSDKELPLSESQAA